MRVYLYESTYTFPDPGNWTPGDNKVECLGAGGRGANPYTPFPNPGALPPVVGPGGGGGAYAWDINLAPAVWPVNVGIYWAGGNDGMTATFWDSYFWVEPPRPGMVVAHSGSGGISYVNPSITSYGGQGGGTNGDWQFTWTNFPADKSFNGGNGGAFGELHTGYGGGGGGAAGPSGAGAAGGHWNAGSVGGASNGGTIPGSGPNAGGVSYPVWDSVHTIAGGGGGGVGAVPPDNGQFGSGTGSGDCTAYGTGYPGAGLLVLTWGTGEFLPPPPPGGAQAVVIG